MQISRAKLDYQVQMVSLTNVWLYIRRQPPTQTDKEQQ